MSQGTSEAISLAPYNQFKRVASATPIISKYKIPTRSALPRITNYHLTIYPHILQKRDLVDRLEQKLVVDSQREFEGTSSDQKHVLNRLIEKNSRIRKRAGFEPGIYECIENQLYNEFLKPEESRAVSTVDDIREEFVVEQVESQSEVITDDLFDLEYPIQEIIFESAIPIERVLDPKTIQESVQARKKSLEKKTTLKAVYGQWLHQTQGQDQSSKHDLEQEAVAAMKMGTTN